MQGDRVFWQEVGLLPPPIHIRDNLSLRPNAYRITLKGVEIGSHEVQPGMYLAINPGRVSGQLRGATTVDPAFGLPAVWIAADARDQAQNAGYTVVDAATVVATHVSQLMGNHSYNNVKSSVLQTRTQIKYFCVRFISFLFNSPWKRMNFCSYIFWWNKPKKIIYHLYQLVVVFFGYPTKYFCYGIVSSALIKVWFS